MNLTYFTLRRLADELRTSLQGRRISKAWVWQATDLVLHVEGAGHLLLSASPQLGRVALLKAPPSAPSASSEWMKRYISRALIDTIHQVPMDRIIEFVLVKRDRLGGMIRSRLVAEMTGRVANVILVGEPEGRILASVRRVTSRTSRTREILPGKPYLPPPPSRRKHPDDVDSKFLKQVLETGSGAVDKALSQSVCGLDPLTARELLHRTAIRGPEGDTERLARALRGAFDAPDFLEGAVGLEDPVDGFQISPIPLTHVAPESHRTFRSVSEAVEWAFAEERRQKTRNRIEKLLRDRRRSLDKKITLLERTLEEAKKADQDETFAHLLMNNLHRIKPGSESLTLENLFRADGAEVTIPLQPDRTPIENARGYLKRARKGKRASPILTQRLEALQERRVELGAAIKRLGDLHDEDDLSRLWAQFREAERLPARTARTASRKKSVKGDIHPRRYLTSEGWQVLVGRNNKENDRLIRRSARDDIFFHVRGCAGSHTVLKRSGKPDSPSKRALREAANVAAFWSKARNAKTVPVDYTEVKFVQKPRGAPPGLVRIRNEKTLFVEPREIKKAEDAGPSRQA